MMIIIIIIISSSNNSSSKYCSYVYNKSSSVRLSVSVFVRLSVTLVERQDGYYPPLHGYYQRSIGYCFTRCHAASCRSACGSVCPSRLQLQ